MDYPLRRETLPWSGRGRASEEAEEAPGDPARSTARGGRLRKSKLPFHSARELRSAGLPVPLLLQGAAVPLDATSCPDSCDIRVLWPPKPLMKVVTVD